MSIETWEVIDEQVCLCLICSMSLPTNMVRDGCWMSRCQCKTFVFLDMGFLVVWFLWEE